MTTTPPPYVPGPPPFPPPLPFGAPVPPKKKRSPLVWILGALGAVVLLCLVGSIIIGVTDGTKDKPAGKTVSATAVAAPLPNDPCGGGICTTSPTTEPTAASTPKASDFVLTPTITDKACFGSAGCNVTFRMKVDYAGPSSLDPDVTWLVVYEITGIDDSPQVGNFTVQGTDVNYDEQSVSTKSSKSKIKLRATSVQQN